MERKVGNVPELISHNLADFFDWPFIQSGEEEQTPEERRTRLKKADSIRRMLADGSTVPVVTSKIFFYYLFYLFVGTYCFSLLTATCSGRVQCSSQTNLNSIISSKARFFSLNSGQRVKGLVFLSLCFKTLLKNSNTCFNSFAPNYVRCRNSSFVKDRLRHFGAFLRGGRCWRAQRGQESARRAAGPQPGPRATGHGEIQDGRR